MSRIIAAVVLASFTASLSAAAAEPYAQTLTSAARNVNVESWEVTSDQLGIRSDASWSVRKQTLRGGKQEGVELIVIDNGAMRITVVPARGMGLLSVTAGDVRLGWDSPVKEVVHPRHVNLQSRGGLGWLEGFNEFMCRCGLESNGHPGTDKFVNNVGDESTMELTLHGKIANIPASEVEVVIDPQPPHRIRVRGRVDERMFYGPKLELWTEVSTEPGSRAFRVSDTITNRGAAEQEFQILYHANFGPPLLEEGATFVGAVDRVVPFNAHAAKGREQFASYAGPTLGFVEQVYCLYPQADADGRTLAMLRNKRQDRAVSVAFSLKELPYLTLWKNTNAVGEGYVTGIEPGTNFPYNRRIEREHGRVPKLGAGASRSFTVDFAVHTGQEQVTRAAQRIAEIQGDRRAKIAEEPQVRP
jgi:hypothetical protein